MSTKEARRAANKRFYERHKEAEKARSKAWRKANPEKYQAWCDRNKDKRSATSRKYYYGITLEDFNQKMASQDSKCAICHKHLVRPSLDHGHDCCPGKKSCGKCIRGILCQRCNTIIGLASDSVEILSTAIQYLKSYQSLEKQALELKVSIKPNKIGFEGNQ
jgi:hypothetical protein